MTALLAIDTQQHRDGDDRRSSFTAGCGRALWKLKIRSNSHTLPKCLSSTCKTRHQSKAGLDDDLKHATMSYLTSRLPYLHEMVDDFERDQLVVALLDARHEVQARIPLVYQLRTRHTMSQHMRWRVEA